MARHGPPAATTRLARGSRRRPPARSSEAASKPSSATGAGATPSLLPTPAGAIGVGDIMSMEAGTAPRPAVKGVRMKRRRNTADREGSPGDDDGDDWLLGAMDADASHAQIAASPVAPQSLSPAVEATAAAAASPKKLSLIHI